MNVQKCKLERVLAGATPGGTVPIAQRFLQPAQHTAEALETRLKNLHNISNMHMLSSCSSSSRATQSPASPLYALLDSATLCIYTKAARRRMTVPTVHCDTCSECIVDLKMHLDTHLTD